MPEAYALHEGAFGRAVVLELSADLVAHAHAEAQLAFWLGGARVEARVGDTLVRYEEDVALGTNAYEAHDARMVGHEGPAVFLVLYIAKSWLDERRSASGQPFWFNAPGVRVDAAVRQSCWRVLDRILSPHPADTNVDKDVEALLLTAMDATRAHQASACAKSTPLVLDQRLRTAVSYMREHVCEPLTMEELAHRVGLSRGHFFALFRDQLNTTPQVFWSAVRVEEAVRRLVHRGEPLTSVAMDLGFSSPGNFSRFFREHMGVTPSRYRRVASMPHHLTGISEP